MASVNTLMVSKHEARQVPLTLRWPLACQLYLPIQGVPMEVVLDKS